MAVTFHARVVRILQLSYEHQLLVSPQNLKRPKHQGIKSASSQLMNSVLHLWKLSLSKNTLHTLFRIV